jgi:hypothetical protein
MTRQELERWEQLRANGKQKFILMYGVLYWGVGVGISFGIVNVLVDHLMGEQVFTYAHMFRTITLGVLGFPLMGYVWGRSIWSYNERRYARVSQKS